jgi:hypothetical protein
VTLFLLAAVLSTADVCVAHAPLYASRAHGRAASSLALTKRIVAAPREKTAVRTEAPLAARVPAYCASPERRSCAAYAKPALAVRAASAAACSERAPPASLA